MHLSLFTGLHLPLMNFDRKCALVSQVTFLSCKIMNSYLADVLVNVSSQFLFNFVELNPWFLRRMIGLKINFENHVFPTLCVLQDQSLKFNNSTNTRSILTSNTSFRR